MATDRLIGVDSAFPDAKRALTLGAGLAFVGDELQNAAISTFLGLTDTPASYAGQTLKLVRVNAGETALEFASVSGAGAQPLDADLTAIAALTGTGIAVRTAADTWALRTLTGSASVNITNGAGVAGDPVFAVLAAGVDHGGLGGLGDDDHTQYALLAGRAGGQTLKGGTAASDNLTLQSTAHATKGKILFGTSAYDEVNNRLGVGTASPTVPLDVVGLTNIAGILTVTNNGSSPGIFYRSGASLLETLSLNNNQAFAVGNGNFINFLSQYGDGGLGSYAQIAVDARDVSAVTPDGRMRFGVIGNGVIRQDYTIDENAALHTWALNGSTLLTLSQTTLALTGAMTISTTLGVTGATTLSSTLNVADGSAAAPSIAFTSDTDTGLFRIGANQLGISVGGTQFVRYGSSGATPFEPLRWDTSITNAANSAITLARMDLTAIGQLGTVFASHIGLDLNMIDNSTASMLTSTVLDANLTVNMAGFSVSTGTVFKATTTVTAGTISEWRGIDISNPTGAGSIADAIGLRIANITKGGTNYAIQSLGGQSFHAGNLRVGSTVDPTVALDVTGAGIINGTLGGETLSIQSAATNDDPNLAVSQGRAATTDATVTTLQTIAITASRTYQIEARIQARRTGGAAGTADDAASYIVRGTYKTAAGVVTLIGSVTTDYSAESQAAWDATLTISGTNILVRVTGAASNNITWHVSSFVSFVGT